MEINFPKLEKRILRFWRENEIFEKSIEGRKRAKNFVFYEGPPTANAAPGLHHVLARVFKDIIPRYKTMRGFKVIRKAGWDTHGLPVELQIEKKLGFIKKTDIEKYGIAKFNKKCKESVWEYKKDWERLTERIGYWLDLGNPYVTYTPDYIESVWWILKEIWKKGLLYQDFKVIPYCPRCGTSLSSHEVAQGYKRIKEPAIYVKFEILNPKFETKGKIYFLVWTTTPWTLPGNVAIAINPKFTYAQVKIGDELATRTSSSSSPTRVATKGREERMFFDSLPSEAQYLILAKDRLNILGRDYEIVKEFKGKDLVGLRYQALYPKEEALKSAYKVLPADFVSLEEGTGLVHIAPAFGADDMELIKNQNAKIKNQNEKFPILLTVDEEGKFKFEVKKFAELFVKDADPLIIEDLKNRGLLFKEELYEHDYPFCWRCHTPLLYYAKKSWFIRMTKVKRDLIKNNQKINWIPSHIKEGRFGEWLKEVKDWALSRERYWGTPLPVWQCKKCGNLEVIGSKNDLLKQKFSTNQYYILRHGETIYQTSKKEIIYPWPEREPILLAEKGEEEIKMVVKKFKKKKIDLIYSSDIPRTRQTAEIVAKELGIKIIFDKRLRDINLGIYHGQKKEEFYKDLPLTIERFYNRKPKKGETFGMVRKRIFECLEDVGRKHQNKNILIVSHGDPLWLLEGTLKGLDDEAIIKQRIKKKTIKNGEFRKIEFKKIPLNGKGELDFHKPYIDEVEFYCQKCGGIMERIPEVIDCWFDSGSMPFAQGHWPFAPAFANLPAGRQGATAGKQNQKSRPPKLFPADYICEAIDQTRGWFYTLLAISTLLSKGPAYKNVISLGHVLDEKGEKMSKSKGNVVDPWLILEKYGVDATRWYFYTVNRPEDSKLFSEKDVGECLRKFILTLWNCYQFFKTYAMAQFLRPWKSHYRKNVLDRWIISKLNGLIYLVTNKLDKYDVTGAARAIENFVVNDLSLWYIRRSRRRFQGPEKKEASVTLGFVLLTLSKLTAPFIPFLSEEIYHSLKPGVKPSIHLEDWPKVNKKLIDKKLEKKMERVREIVALALAQRAKSSIKVRQPLLKLKIKNALARPADGSRKKLKINDELINLIKDEVNIKEIVFDKKIKNEIELDTQITPQLKEEGIIREIIRHIQEMRKKIGLKPKNKIFGFYLGPRNLNEILFKNREKIMKEGKIESFKIKEKRKFDFEKEIEIEKENLWLAIKKVEK